MPRRKPSIPRTTIDSELSFSRKKDCKDHTIMLGVFHTYVPLKPITCTKKSQLMKARYNIACNLSIEDIRILAFYTISSFRCLHYIIMGILPSLSSKAFILPYHQQCLTMTTFRDHKMKYMQIKMRCLYSLINNSLSTIYQILV